MANAPKRLWVLQDPEFRDYCKFFLAEKATAVFAETAPNADDLALAKLAYAGKVNLDHVAMVVVNDATLGATIDTNVTAGVGITITAGVATAIRNALLAGYRQLAISYRAAGLLEG
jgi:hypothetical protein